MTTKTRFDIDLIDLVRPDAERNDPITKLNVIAHLLRTCDDKLYGARKKPVQWSPLIGWLRPNSYHVASAYVFSLFSSAEIHRVLHQALLGKPTIPRSGDEEPVSTFWRRHERIHIDERHRIVARHGSYGWPPKRLDWLLRGPHNALVARLNPVHADAVVVNKLFLTAKPVGPDIGKRRRWSWSVVLDFGVDGSGWDHPLATQRSSETIESMLERAQRYLAGMQHPRAYFADELVSTDTRPRGHYVLTRDPDADPPRDYMMKGRRLVSGPHLDADLANDIAFGNTRDLARNVGDKSLEDAAIFRMP